MQYGICNLSIVPVRLEPSDSSEMVTQLLYGDHFKVLEKEVNGAASALLLMRMKDGLTTSNTWRLQMKITICFRTFQRYTHLI